MTNPDDQRERSDLFERLRLYRWAYQHRSRYDSEPAMPVATAIASAAWRMSRASVQDASRRGV